MVDNLCKDSPNFRHKLIVSEWAGDTAHRLMCQYCHHIFDYKKIRKAQSAKDVEGQVVEGQVVDQVDN